MPFSKAFSKCGDRSQLRPSNACSHSADQADGTPIPSPISLAPMTRQITAMIVALFWTSHVLSSSRNATYRSPIVKQRTTGAPGPMVPINTKTASTTACLPVDMATCASAATAAMRARGSKLQPWRGAERPRLHGFAQNHRAPVPTYRREFRIPGSKWIWAEQFRSSDKGAEKAIKEFLRTKGGDLHLPLSRLEG